MLVFKIEDWTPNFFISHFALVGFKVSLGTWSINFNIMCLRLRARKARKQLNYLRSKVAIKKDIKKIDGIWLYGLILNKIF